MGIEILNLEDVRRGDVAIAGGKGANLGELIGEGFPVPPGFVVPARACEEFFQHIELKSKIENLKELSADKYDQYCASIREVIEKTDLPSELESFRCCQSLTLLALKRSPISVLARTSGICSPLEPRS